MMQTKGKVILAAPVHNALIEGLLAAGYTCELHEHITQSVAPGIIHDCRGIITSTRLQLDRDLLDAAPGLKWIGRMGSGMEVIDVPYATQKGIACYSSPEGNCNAVAEHALGMLLALVRRINVSNAELKQGVWRRNENRGIELEGKTIGIIGYGHTGRALAKKLSGFDMKVLVYDKYHIPEATTQVTPATLADIQASADIISFHVPQNADTVYYFDDRFVENMNKKFILINTSRGQVVDTMALGRGIARGRILGACLDVFEREPVASMPGETKQIMNEILDLPNVIATPHIAGYTQEALLKMSQVLLEKIIF